MSLLFRSTRKKMLMSARFTGEPNSAAIPSASRTQAVSMSSAADSSIISSAVGGAGYWPRVCCWIKALAVAARNVELGVVDLDRLAPAAAVFQVDQRTSFGANQRDGRVLKPLGGNTIGRQAHQHGRACIDGLARGHHFDGARQADDPRRSSRAAPAGIEAELDFRKAQLGFGHVGHQPAVAPDGQLRSASQAKAVDRGHGDERQRRKPLKQPPAAVAHRHGLLGRRIERGDEFPQIGPDNERPRLCPSESQARTISGCFSKRSK